jgi:hypothetical protein
MMETTWHAPNLQWKTSTGSEVKGDKKEKTTVITKQQMKVRQKVNQMCMWHV